MNGSDIGNFNLGSKAEGEKMVLDSLGKPWLEVLKIDDIATTVPTFLAAYLCTVTESTVTPPVTPPVFPNSRTDMIYTSDGLIQVFGVDGALVYTSPATGGTVKIGAVSR